MKKIFLLLWILLGGLTMVACSENTPSKPVEEYTKLISGIKDIEIEVEETYTLEYILNKYPEISVSSSDEQIVSVNENVLIGNKVGETTVVLQKENKKQLIPVKVYEKGALSLTFSFDKERLAGKKIVAFGDSVTANATIGGGRTYFDIFATFFQMKRLKNYAIGGTTATYTYEGSNIYKEYADNKTVLDGVRVVKKAYDMGELDNVDYAFIAYGHNDQYFQPPITVDGDDSYDVNSFDSCHSFKGSYRYMIETLKLANPNVRIILLNCTYSEYDKSNPSRYGKTYSYADYRNAISEIGTEYNLTTIEPWDYLSIFFDAHDNKIYYKDAVHLSERGHLELGQFICSYREQ